MADNSNISRRRLLEAGVGAAGIAMATSATAASAGEGWDYQTDVLCVGAGGAGCAAAVAAVDANAQVMLVEKLPLVGGTTSKSGGVLWIPNNFALRQQGIHDERQDCLRFMARYAYPAFYSPDSPTLGLDEMAFALLAAYYDNGSEMVDRLQSLGIVQFQQFRLWQANLLSSDYADHLPENKVPTGRALEITNSLAKVGGGVALIAKLTDWLRAKNVPIMTETPVTDLITDGKGKVIGAVAQQEGKAIRIRARRGVVFGSGGYVHNLALVDQHQPIIYGSCALPGATGDLVRMAEQVGAGLGTMHISWRTEVPLMEAMANRSVSRGLGGLPGDSMLVVNKYGRRPMNEKAPYHERGTTHLQFDTEKIEYPNQLLFMLFDERTRNRFGGSHPIPSADDSFPWLIEGSNWQDLFRKIGAQLSSVGPRIGHIALHEDFPTQVAKTIERFNGAAKSGVDPDHGRGGRKYDRDWHIFASIPNKDSKYPANPMPNNTLHPIADTGPYYAIILAPGALDTCGGPQIDQEAHILDPYGKPVPGLYGAGNCIASPAGGGYFGPGATVGPAMTFGYIAGRSAARNRA